MQLTWLGHAAFLLETDDGARLLTDPVDRASGYDLNGVRADVVTLSHRHHDHCALDCVSGAPTVIESLAPQTVCGFAVQGVRSFHDDVQGKRRGENTIFRIEADGKVVVHFGDLGHFLSPQQARTLTDADVLLIPVGGVYTLDGAAAAKQAAALQPRLAIPMHFATPQLTFSLHDASAFLSRYCGASRQLAVGETIRL